MSKREGRATSTLKMFDIFSLPFKFNLGDEEKEKKTVFGGLSSLIILFLSIIYFAYLCYLYFANKIQPAIALSNEFSVENFQIQIEQSFIAIQIITQDGSSIYDFEKKQGKVYLNLMSQYTLDGNQSKIATQYPLIQCEDPSLTDFMCFDLKSFSSDEQFNLGFDAKQKEKFAIQFFINICNSKNLSNGQVCEDEQVIRKTILTYATKITVRMGLKQYNTKTKQLENRIKEEFFYLDEALAFYTKFNLEKTDLSISEGFIVQSTQQSRFFSDFNRKDITASQSYLANQMGSNIIGGMVFFIAQEGAFLSIQFPQFTTLLAQFTSVFNSLMFIGIFCKIFAQTEIVQSFAELQLKTYFKQTAVQLVEEVCEQSEVKQVKSGGTVCLWSYIQKMDFKSVGKRLNISILQKLKLILLPSKKNNQQESNQVKIFKQLVDSSNRSLNIFEIEKEIIQLKIMLRLLLSVEQFAAMQLCGSKVAVCSSIEQEKLLEQEQNVQSSDGSKGFETVALNKKKDSKGSLLQVNAKLQKKVSATVLPLEKEKEELDVQIQQNNFDDVLNHLEKIDRIERDQDYFQKCVDQFLQKNSSSLDELNKRIIGCMIGQDQIQTVILENENKQ